MSRNGRESEFYLLMTKRPMIVISKSEQCAFQCDKKCVLTGGVQGEAE